jgi:hypothetical protein
MPGYVSGVARITSKKGRALPRKKKTPIAAPTSAADSPVEPGTTPGVPATAMPSEPSSVGDPTVDDASEEARAPVKIRESTATGDEKIEILKHDFFDVYEDNRWVLKPAGLNVTIRNLTELTIATAIIEAAFYDMAGHVLETATHKAVELWKDTGRAIRINSKIMEVGKIKSYDVKVARTRTAEQERVQLRAHDINRNQAGEDVVLVIVKNVSKAASDAAVVVTLYGANKEEVGRKVAVLRDIGPETIRQCELAFKLHEGDRWGTYRIEIGELA